MESKVPFWPLYVVFILTVIGGTIGLLHPQAFGQPSSDLTVGSVLGSVALVMAIAFALPVGVAYAWVPRRLGNPGQPNANSVLGRLRALQQAIGEDQAQPENNRLLGRLRALQQAIGDDPTHPSEGTLLHRLEQLRVAINNLKDAVGNADQIQAGTVLSRLGPPGGAAPDITG
jgi:hypothetical protein